MEIFSEQEKDLNKKPKTTSIWDRTLSRRALLKKFAVGTISLPILFKSVEASLYEGLGSMMNGTLSKSLSHIDQGIEAVIPETRNETYKPMVVSIKDAISAYENLGGKAYYKKSPDYKSISDYSNVVSTYSNFNNLPKNPIQLFDNFKADLTGDLKDAYAFSDGNISTSIQLFPQGSGFLNRFEKSVPNAVSHDTTGIHFHNSFYAKVAEVGAIELEEANNYVEYLRSNTGELVPSSKILEFYLHKNQGDLSSSIYDTSIFLKAKARSIHPESGATFASSENISWYRENILDEYQGPNFNEDTNLDQAGNLIGKAYHSWNQVALLKFFPADIVSMGVVHRQLITFHAQGLAKTRGDLATMGELSDIEECLRTYSD